MLGYWPSMRSDMKLLRQINQLKKLENNCVATIGNFDGVHRGHQSLLAKLHEQAVRLGLPMLVVLFEPQPSEFFNSETAPARLYRLREKLQALSDCGVDYVYCLRFDKKLVNLSPDFFAKEILFSQLGVKYLILGEDFRFGRDRLGDLKLLKQIGQSFNAHVEICPDFCSDGLRVSSTRIRHALYLGDLKQASAMLGRQYRMSGRVLYGQGMGRQWGVPTANLNVTSGRLPLRGVFCVQVQREDQSLLAGVANIGCRPTVDGSKNVLEVHLFDFNQSLYNEMLQVFFLCKLRDEIKFSSVDALIAQIHLDVAAARNMYESIE